MGCRRWSCVKLRTCQDCRSDASWKFWREGNTWRQSCKTEEGRKVKCMSHWFMGTFILPSPSARFEVQESLHGLSASKFVEQKFSMFSSWIAVKLGTHNISCGWCETYFFCNLVNSHRVIGPWSYDVFCERIQSPLLIAVYSFLYAYILFGIFSYANLKAKLFSRGSEWF